MRVLFWVTVGIVAIVSVWLFKALAGFGPDGLKKFASGV
jgi:hypothetical protein